MPRKANLRAVTDDEKPPKIDPKSVTQAASDGDRRDLLVAMRSRVATAVQDPNTPARDLAALTRRLMEIAKDIDAIDAEAAQEAAENVDADDEAFDAEAL